MDNFRRRTPPVQQHKALDGFFSKPTASTRHRSAQASLGKRAVPAVDATAPARRTVNDFRRPEGLHVPPRQSLQPLGAAALAKRSAESPKQPLPRLNMELPAADAPAPRGKSHKKPAVKTSKLRRIRTWTLRTATFAVVMVLLAGGFLFGKGYFKLQKVFQGGSSAAALKTNVDPTLLKGEGDGRVNVLLLGVGGADHSGGDLTDTIMVASVDPVNNQAVLLSIPRDLWTKMPNNYISNYQKINAAYESGKYEYLGKQDQTSSDHKAVLAGFQGIDSVVERVAGIPIHYNAVVNFHAFSQGVDTVGGVTINAPEQLYDPTMAWENGWNPVLAKAGLNSFNGKQALNYVRSRETTSDFARGQRQRQVLVALKDKVATAGTLTNPVKISNLLGTFGDNVQSDVSLSDMVRMAAIAKKIPSDQIQSISLAEEGNSFVTTGNINGLSVVMPKAGLEDYTQIQAYIRGKLKDGYIAKENAMITVLNGTATPGLASQKADELKSYGYNVTVVDNAPTQNYAKTTIVDLSKGSKKYTLNYLKKRLDVTATTSQLPTGIVAGTANIVIIIGNDASTTTAQD